MYENLSDFLYGKEVISLANTFKFDKGVYVEEIQPFCLDAVNHLTNDDIIINEPLSGDGTSFLKPTSIYFKNNCYILGHTLIGIMYRPTGHFFNDNFEGFTCLSIDDRLLWNIECTDKYTKMFILKCKPNQYSKIINIDSNWMCIL